MQIRMEIYMTKAQAEVLKVIQKFWNEHGYSPSFAELQSILGYKTLSAVHKHCMQLKKRGYINHEVDSRRSIELTDKGMKYAA